MNPLKLLLAPSFGLLLVTSGCVRPGLAGNLAVTGALVAYEVASAPPVEREWTTEDDGPDDDDAASEAALAHVPLDVPPPPAPVVVPARFDLGGAYGALTRVDLGPCKAQGLAPGYGRVVLGFEPDGAPAGVAVEMPPGSSPIARACVERAFRAVRVAPFDGAPVNVRRPFFVKA